MRVRGNATLFSGSIVETVGAPLQIQLEGGQRLRLSTETRARVYEKMAVLESGFGQFERAQGYEVEARSLRMSPVSADTVTRIRLASGRKVMVAAVRGAVRVRNSAGLLVATVPSGQSFDFEALQEQAGAGAAGAATATGIGVGATVAIVGGVAVAATVGGLAAVGALPGLGEETPAGASR